MGHKHPVYDTDTHFSINPVTREISTTDKIKTIIQGDHNSERFSFDIPKLIDASYSAFQLSSYYSDDMMGTGFRFSRMNWSGTYLDMLEVYLNGGSVTYTSKRLSITE